MSEDMGNTGERRGPQAEPAKEGTGETGEQRTTQTGPGKPSTPASSEDKSEQGVAQTQLEKSSIGMSGKEDVVWVRFAPSQVVRTVVIALLATAVVLGALFLLWQVRTIIGWGILSLFLAAVLNPAVNWLQRRGIGRSIGILLTYLGVVVGLLFIGGIFVPVVFGEIRDLIDFIVVTQNPGGITEYLRTLLEQFRLGFFLIRSASASPNYPASSASWPEASCCRLGAGHQRRHVRLCAREHPDAHVLPAPEPRGLYERRAQGLRRAAAPTRAAPLEAVGGGLRLHYRQPRHQLYLRGAHLYRA